MTAAMVHPMSLAADVETGATLVELIVGTALGLLVMLGLTSLLSVTLAARARAADRGAAVTALAGAVDQIARDVRLAGFDPEARGVAALADASATSLVIAADLDGSGSIDTASEEQVGYRLSGAGGDTLQRIVGRQTLPLLSELAADGFRLRYLDSGGAELDPGAPGALAAVRAVTVELALRATRAHGALRMNGGARLLNR
jgi:Tfp pilus assembly protein PilW